MKRALITLFAMGLVLLPFVSALAKEEGCAAGAPAAAAKDEKKVEKKEAKTEEAAKEITLTGKISCEQVDNKKTGKKMDKFFLTDDQGNKIGLPTPHAKKGEDASKVIALKDYLDAKVKLVGTGVTETTKKGTTKTHVKSIACVEKVAN